MKTIVEKKYREHIKQLSNAAKAIDRIRGEGKSFTQLQLNYCQTLQAQIQRSTDIMNDTLSNTFWDNLVIAFFGETNAGKSTIIETLRILFDNNKEKGTDGLIVGDGRADFTQTYDEYQLTINNKKFTLIDVPGIEGEETDEFKAHIRKALQKAHCVFYVQGQNKQPDRGTAEKIKQYLSDWVSVYSIQNVRADTSYYDEEEERIRLNTNNVCRLGGLITDSFFEILGKDIYRGNITLQALLALCSKAHFSEQRQDLKKKQSKLLRYFGNENAIFNYSNFQNLIDLIDKKSMDFSHEITEANKQKLIATAKSSYYQITKLEKEYNELIKNLTESLKTFHRDCKSLINRTESNVKDIINSTYQSFYKEAKDIAYRVIDDDKIENKKKKETIKKRINSRSSVYSKDLDTKIKNELITLNENIERKRKDLLDRNQQMSSSISSINLNSKADLNDAIGELDITIGDVVDFFSEVGGGALAGSFAGWVGAVIGAVVGLFLFILKKIFFSDGGKGKAKEKVRKSMDDAEQKDTSRSKIINNYEREFENLLLNLQKKVSAEIKSISNLQDTIKFVKLDIQKYINALIIKDHGEI